MANTRKFGKKEMAEFLNTISRKQIKLEPDIIGKLRQAFAIGCTIEEACFYCEINPVTYWRWCKKYPQLKEYVNEMKHRLGLKSKQNIAKIIEEGDVSNSWRYLERTQPQGYAETIKQEHSGEIKSIPAGYPEDEELKKELRDRYMQNAIKREQERKKNEPQAKS